MDDLVMVDDLTNSTLSEDFNDGRCDASSVITGRSISEDSCISVLLKADDLPDLKFVDGNGPPSISTACLSQGPPLEQREDIKEMKMVPDILKNKLNFNNEEKLLEVLEQMKAREHIDQEMENELQKLKKVDNVKVEDYRLLEASSNACEKLAEARLAAKEGKTTLKRAMEVVEVALPPFLIACEKSSEVFNLSDDVSKEIEMYEQCVQEKKRAAFNFKLGEEKTKEAQSHLDKCIKISEEDEKRITEKKKAEEEQNRIASFTNAQKEMDDIIFTELEEVNTCLKYCSSDLENINKIQVNQEKRCTIAGNQFESRDKEFEMKIITNRKNQDALKAQLADLISQEKKLVENRTFQQQVQQKASEWNKKISTLLLDLKKDITEIQSCALTSSKVMESMKEFGGKLLGASIKTEREYLDHLSELDIEAKNRRRSALATNVVENQLNLDNAAANIEEYAEKYKGMKEELKEYVRRGMRLEAERLKGTMKEYKDEMKREEKKKKQKEEIKDYLMEILAQCDEELLKLGRNVDSVDDMYLLRKQLDETNLNDDLVSLEFSEDEGSDDDSD